jgi:hypothetical protein
LRFFRFQREKGPIQFMLFSNATFIGIDPTAGQRPLSYAALDGDLSLLALGQGDIDEVLAFVAGQYAALVAVSAPRRPNQGVMDRSEVRENLSPPPRPGRWTNFRLAEYELWQHNLRIPRTPGEKEECPAWMQMGFTLFRRLESLKYQPYPQEDTGRQSLEVYPHACFAALLDRIPFAKDTLEGRLQRQLILFENKLDIPDPMRVFEEITRHRLLQGILPLDDLYPAEELDALIAAYTAWVAATQPEQVTLLGDSEEGQIVLPVSKLKNCYCGSHAKA